MARANLPWHSSVSFTHVLQEAEGGASLCASPPQEVQRAGRSLLGFLFSRLGTPRVLSLPSQDRHSCPFTRFIALLWRLSSALTCCRYCGAQSCSQCSLQALLLWTRAIHFHPVAQPHSLAGVDLTAPVKAQRVPEGSAQDRNQLQPLTAGLQQYRQHQHATARCVGSCWHLRLTASSWALAS